MSMWARVQRLSGDSLSRIKNIYGEHFPIEIRHFFADWIESQPWWSFDESDAKAESRATVLLNTFIQRLEDKSTLETTIPFLEKINLQDFAQQFKDLYLERPLDFVRVIRRCLQAEEAIIKQSEHSESDIIAQVRAIQHQTEITEAELARLAKLQKQLKNVFSDTKELAELIVQLAKQPSSAAKVENERQILQQKNNTENQLESLVRDTISQRIHLAKNLGEIFQNLSGTQGYILNLLVEWKRRVQWFGPGGGYPGNGESTRINTLQTWCELIADQVITTRQQIKELELSCGQLPLEDSAGSIESIRMLSKSIDELFTTLVTSTFIVEDLPSQVVMKDRKFSTAIRLLVGQKLDIKGEPPLVTASIISEDEARNLMLNDTLCRKGGEILKNEARLTVHCGKPTAYFRDMQIVKVCRRTERKGNETVTEEKFSIFFQSEFKVGDDIAFNVWALSLPIVVIVNVSQERNALATIVWDNAFAETGRMPFQVPDQVPWPQAAEMLTNRFHSDCGLGLTQNNCNYLASKIFGYDEVSESQNYANHSLAWAQFNKINLPHKSNYTFWEWLNSVLTLIRKYLLSAWKEGKIEGFISRQRADQLLIKKPVGTFMLRFSDTKKKAISISCVVSNPNCPETNYKEVCHELPRTDRDLATKTLEDHVRSLPDLKYLYPGTPVEEAFPHTSSTVPKRTSDIGPGYVSLVTTFVTSQISPPEQNDVDMDVTDQHPYNSGNVTATSDSSVNPLSGSQSPDHSELFSSDLLNIQQQHIKKSGRSSCGRSRNTFDSNSMSDMFSMDSPPQPLTQIKQQPIEPPSLDAHC